MHTKPHKTTIRTFCLMRQILRFWETEWVHCKSNKSVKLKCDWVGKQSERHTHTFTLQLSSNTCEETHIDGFSDLIQIVVQRRQLPSKVYVRSLYKLYLKRRRQEKTSKAKSPRPWLRVALARWSLHHRHTH